MSWGWFRSNALALRLLLLFLGLASARASVTAPAQGSDASADWHTSVRQFASTGFPIDKMEAVRAAIRTHMFDRDPVGPEAKYLHDADALDWLGAVGVARILALVDPNGGDPDGPKAVKMLVDNLASVPQRVQSPAGRRLAKIRAAELRRFIDELRRETKALRTL